tara:strand:+ start:396 stop:980 length:585 start_codon:yes stop_codon:yes gene_type:complete
MSQDDARENKQIEIFGLERMSETNRGSEYVSDARAFINGQEEFFELKTGQKTSFSTARGMCREKLESWETKNTYYIFSQHKVDKESEDGFYFIRHVVCKFEHLKFWADKVIDDVHISGHAGKIGRDQYYQTIRNLLVENISDDLLAKFDKTVVVGTEYNDPKININKIVANGGKELDLDGDLKQQLWDYVEQNR